MVKMREEAKETTMEQFRLPNKKVMIKPILRKGRWLEKGHSGNLLYDDASIILTAPLSEQTGGIKNPLTKAEQNFFENKALSNMDFEVGDLSPNKRKGNFWNTFEVKLKKSQSILKEDTVLFTLDLSDPVQYLKYKVLLANSGPGGIVAPSWDARFNRGSYKVVVVEKDHEKEEVSKRSKDLTEAYTYFGKIRNSKEKMYEVLSIYYLIEKKASKPPQDAKDSFYITEIQNIISDPKSLETFLDIISNEDMYNFRLMIHRGIDVGAINYSISGYELPDGKPIGSSMEEAIKFFRNDKNQEEKLKVVAQIEQAYEEDE